jgi:hypothetical protein
MDSWAIPGRLPPPPFRNVSSVHILYAMSGQSLWIALTWFDKLLYPVWISLIFSVHNFYSWIRRWWDFHSLTQHTATQHTFNIRHSMYFYEVTTTSIKSEQTGQYLWHSNWADVIPIMHHSQTQKSFVKPF